MKQEPLEVHLIDVNAIKPFVSRARDPVQFERVKQSIAKDGLHMPIQVRKLGKVEHGIRYELVYGEGRLRAFKELGIAKIPATITDAPEMEIVGRFLAENLIRKSLPWWDKARLIKDELDSGKTVAELAESYSITTHHVERCIRVLDKTAKGTEGAVVKMQLSEAESLITLPADHQRIVVEIALESGMDGQIKMLVSKAREASTAGELSKSALKQSLERVDEDLLRTREKLKLKRLHHSLGPSNLALLLKDARFVKALAAENVNVEKFQSVWQD